MLHLGHNVVGILRLNSCPAVRLAPATRRSSSSSSSSSSAMCFSSNSSSTSSAAREGEKEKMKMDKSKKIREEDEEQHQDPAEAKDHGNIMGHSYGEGYATRSDEEGFGGIYGGNQSINNPSDVSHPDYDKTQGSEVAGKEKARNQPHASS